MEKEKNDNLHDISSYEPAVIANKIKKECMQQNTTLKTMLQELSIGSNMMSHMSHGADIRRRTRPSARRRRCCSFCSE